MAVRGSGLPAAHAPSGWEVAPGAAGERCSRWPTPGGAAADPKGAAHRPCRPERIDTRFLQYATRFLQYDSAVTQARRHQAFVSTRSWAPPRGARPVQGAWQPWLRPNAEQDAQHAASTWLYDATRDLIAAREAHGFSVRSLAAEIGASPSVVGELESGSRWPDLKSLGAYADAVGFRFAVVGDHTVTSIRRGPAEAVAAMAGEGSLASRSDRVACWRDVAAWSVWWLRRVKRMSLVDAASLSGARIETHAAIERAPGNDYWFGTAALLACAYAVDGVFVVQPREDTWVVAWPPGDAATGGIKS